MPLVYRSNFHFGSLLESILSLGGTRSDLLVFGHMRAEQDMSYVADQDARRRRQHNQRLALGSAVVLGGFAKWIRRGFLIIALGLLFLAWYTFPGLVPKGGIWGRSTSIGCSWGSGRCFFWALDSVGFRRIPAVVDQQGLNAK